MFHFLIGYLKVFYEQGEEILLNKELSQRRDKYLLECDEFYQWFKDTYKQTNQNTDILKIDLCD